MQRSAFARILGLILLLRGAAPAEGAEVMIHHFAYQPSQLTVEVGTTVRWTNMDSIEHTVTSQTGPGTLTPSGVFDSGLLGMGDVFEYTFAEPGPFYYFCIPHGSSMQGMINVLPRSCRGDLDGDLVIALGDLTIILANFGMLSGASSEQGDLDADQDVDLEDLTALLVLFGTSC